MCVGGTRSGGGGLLPLGNSTPVLQGVRRASVSHSRGKANPTEPLTKRADRALYAAKATGRRTFCIMPADDALSNSAPPPTLNVPSAPSLETG